jgi:hypothetical protein
MSIRVASAPVSWGVMEVAGFEGRQTYGEVLDEMVQAGYEGTELGPYGFLPAEPARLKAELSRRGLALVGAFVPLPLATPERHEAGFQEAMKTADLLAKSAAPFVVLADEMSPARMAVAGRVTANDGLTSAQWNGAAKLLMRTAEECNRRGLRAVFHHHVGTFVETPDEVERLCALTGRHLSRHRPLSLRRRRCRRGGRALWKTHPAPALQRRAARGSCLRAPGEARFPRCRTPRSFLRIRRRRSRSSESGPGARRKRLRRLGGGGAGRGHYAARCPAARERAAQPPIPP